MTDEMTWKTQASVGRRQAPVRECAGPRSAIGRLRLIDAQCACGLAMHPKKLSKVDKD
jgi:hypothetical protein